MEHREVKEDSINDSTLSPLRTDDTQEVDPPILTKSSGCCNKTTAMNTCNAISVDFSNSKPMAVSTKSCMPVVVLSRKEVELDTDSDNEQNSGELHHSEEIELKSILKVDPSTGTNKQVKFVDFLTTIDISSSRLWIKKRYETRKIVAAYINACQKYGISPDDTILKQLELIPNKKQFKTSLNLTGVRLNCKGIIDVLEIVFQMTTFNKIYVRLTGSRILYVEELFDMLSFYDLTSELLIIDTVQDKRLWSIMINNINRCPSLGTLSFCEMVFRSKMFSIICENLKVCDKLVTLKFVGCVIPYRLYAPLTDYLQSNCTLRELHLPFCNLYCKDIFVITDYLTKTFNIRLLNLSNNKISDRGFQFLAKALLDQSIKSDEGVNALLLNNNCITPESANFLETIFITSHVTTLNLGFNQVSDQILTQMPSITDWSKIKMTALGFQSTSITCVGLRQLMNICKKSKCLLHLNLKGNQAIKTETLNEFANILLNTTLLCVEIDDTNTSCSDPESYVEVVNKIQHLVEINRSQINKSINSSLLCCESDYIPQVPTIHLTRSRSFSQDHLLRSRFNVSLVTENLESSDDTSSVESNSISGTDAEPSAGPSSRTDE